jgi:hypothetical protein
MLLSTHLISIDIEHHPGENRLKTSDYITSQATSLEDPPPPILGLYCPDLHYSISSLLYTFISQ